MMSRKDVTTEIPKTYNPTEAEQKWYDYWEQHGYFHSEPDEREPFTIVIPPPNVTGRLHMGHMLNNTLQDVLTRRARMQGKNACWVPGTDHASIATEAKVVRKLRKEGIKKSDLSREEFLKYAWEWTDEHGGIILSQLKRLGASCDWERTRFTLEEELYEAVIDAFIDLYDRGYIYRGLRMINWDPEAKTALSDEEVIHREETSRLYHVRYDIMESDETVTIATTRPETILADTAVCVNPNDERYRHLIGKTAVIPLVKREVPIIADDYVDPEYGTGCLKVTPAHDPNDYEIGQRHGLEVVDMFNDDGTLSEAASFFVGQDRFEARKSILNKLEEKGQLAGSEELINKVGYSERTDVPIEPRLSLQWFCKMEELAAPALENVLNDSIKFHPAKFKNSYRHWMENIRDWCISRQLWWGHRIPAWYYGEGKDDYVVARSKEEALNKAREKSENEDLQADNLRQEEDVLDTWFSSWLWPISVFAPEYIRSGSRNRDLDYYYPTSVLVTGFDIMFFWVARMIMAGYIFADEKPFDHVFFTGMVRDNQRRKMSKSLGNSPDPLDLIDKYGADGTRVGMLFSAPAGNDLLFDENLCEQGRNFSNKIWNAFRFLSMNMEPGSDYHPMQQTDPENLVDRWMQSRLHQTIQGADNDFERYRVNEALQKIYKLIWDDYCDWYIEAIKSNQPGEPIPKDRIEQALGFFEQLLKLLHPFMPFITEEVWQRIQDRSPEEAILISSWPESDESRVDPDAVDRFGEVQKMISSIRHIQADMNLPTGSSINLYLNTNDSDRTKQLKESEWIFRKFLKIETFKAETGMKKPAASASAVVGETEIYLPLEGLIDLEKERDRIRKEISQAEGFLKSVEKKLTNAKFVENAPDEVVERERNKKKDAGERLEKLNALLEELG